MSLVEQVLAQASRTPSAVALVAGDGKELSYGELRRRVLSVRHGLREHGLRPGDGVLFSVRPSPESLVLAIAVVAAGGCVIFADPGAGPEMFTARMRLARPRWSAAESVLYAASRLRPVRAYARRRGLLLPNLSALDVARHVYTGRRLPGVPTGALALKRLLKAPPTELDEGTDPGAPAAVIFTSGTTARPRAVVHTGASLSAALGLLRERVPVGPGDVVHTDQLMLGLPTLASGARWSLPPLTGSAALFAEQLRQRRATHTYCVPVRLAEVLDAAGGPLPPSLRHLLLGSAPAPAGVLRRAVAAAPQAEVLSVYAMTEMLPVALATAADKIAHVAGGDTGDLLGAPLPGVRVSLAADGELLLAGPNRSPGYLGEPPSPWLPTGDLARLDAAGRLVLLGRKKDMLIRGAFNLYPGLYEPAITALPGVAEAAYVGVPDPVHGDERVVLAVVADDPAAAAALPARLRRDLPGIVDHDALPDDIVVLPGLPRTGRGRKVDRQALRDLVTPGQAAS
ncbi:class I adenylate-forming enzyme family protein [Catellatospora citrea]|uniref:Fatty-acyl-CoA synthase n=1 Tax=Catellatospora citrea TaxID=53366 RepID=A0A8J3KFC8_9ACTN|nr:class I adenylate-forming enzyme family protein [Catellatospora citrea]RKE12891.1 acyl-CoA synthetase (AMP-forming)/AMP-acid ligase II [Catellatospora citrea]GIF95868.1 fatty-acyl-CoA synthase [Catellatospora citrea]